MTLVTKAKNFPKANLEHFLRGKTLYLSWYYVTFVTVGVALGLVDLTHQTHLSYTDMKKNLGLTDRLLRVLVGLLLIAAVFAFQANGLLATLLIGLAAIMALTSLVGFCPLYLPFGLDTFRRKAHKALSK